MKIAMCASEAVPFAKTGGLADVLGALPQALEIEAQEVIIILPYYKEVQQANIKANKISEDIFCAQAGKNIKVYFIVQDKFFNRENLYGDKHGDYKDNLGRFAYYCQRALKLLKEIGFKADILHCHDWQSALIPIYLKELYSQDTFYKDTKTIFTIHNLGYQGLFPKEEFLKLGLPWSAFTPSKLEFFEKINLLKGGIVYSDIITTVSPTYSKEIQGKELGFGLEGVLSLRKDSLFGILNGLDYSIWNPQTDKIIRENYSFLKLGGKAKNKEALQKLCGLPISVSTPLLGIVSRLAEQKGFDLLAQAVEEICKMDLQLVILGTGQAKYHQLFEKIAKKYPKTFSLHLKFDDLLAHKIYAGSDIFLMPSHYEPCGLGQLISLKYGTIPLVYKTGGLADTVNKDNGFVFDEYDTQSLLNKVKEAVKAFNDKNKWQKLIKAAMGCDFSWEAAAKKYIEIYEKAKK